VITSLGAELRQLPVARPDLVAAVDVAIRVSFDFAQLQQMDLKGTADLECIGCGCTDSCACPDGCAWVSVDPPICSGCA
jgi:hypothetical protein